MRHTTHKLTPEQKESLFIKYKDLIYMIFCCNGYMLRKQIRKLFHILSGRSEKDIEFDIAELILTGFLLQKTINKDTRTQMLYLSKYPKSQFLNVTSRDVPPHTENFLIRSQSPVRRRQADAPVFFGCGSLSAPV